MWRQWKDVDRVEAYDEILNELGRFYPANGDQAIKFKQQQPENDISFI